MAKPTLCSILSLLLLSLQCTGSNAEPAVTAQLDSLMTQWLSLEQQRSQIQAHWRQKHISLQQQLDLLTREAESLQEILADNSQQHDAVNQQRLALLEQQTSLETNQDQVTQTLVQASAAIHQIAVQLPPPLADQWQPKLAQLDRPQANNSDKLAIVLELLSQLTNFQDRVVLHQTTMTFAEQQTHQVAQIYLGIARGWYVSSDGQFAGYGQASATGWQWQTQDEIPELDAQQLQDLVAMLQDPTRAELISLPVRLQSGGQKGPGAFEQ